MRVYSEARPAGGGKTVGIGLDDNDMNDLDGYEYLTPIERWRAMSDRADLMLVEYLVRRGDISEEYAAQRIREIKQGHPA